MDDERELRPFRNLIYAVALFTACVVAMLLWDMGWRADDHLTRLIAVAIGINAAFELIHVLPALEVSRDAVDAARLAGLLRPVTWPPAAHVLPIGLCMAFALRKQPGY